MDPVLTPIESLGTYIVYACIIYLAYLEVTKKVKIPAIFFLLYPLGLFLKQYTMYMNNLAHPSIQSFSMLSFTRKGVLFILILTFLYKIFAK